MNVLIFSFHQFGLLVDPLKYCQYASKDFNLTYLGWDYGKPKIEAPLGVKVKYISRQGNIMLRNIRLLRALSTEVASGGYDVIFMHYTRGVSLIRLMHPGKRMIFDIRTLSVDRQKWKRKAFNSFLKIESLFFDNISVISEGVAKRMKLKKYFLLPLGGDVINIDRSVRCNSFHLLYVGTLAGRDIIKCIWGLEKYIKMSGDNIVQLTIVGDGTELKEIMEFVQNSDVLFGRVHCLGRILHSQLTPYFERADVGISFIPITEWYNDQPPTKTFEYLLSGLPVIATRTLENEKVLKDDPYCILIRDDEESFAESLFQMKEVLYQNPRPSYFYNRYSQYSWESVVKEYFVQMMKEIKQ